MAYNEEANIGRLLGMLLQQKLKSVVIDEIIIVASGCTDRTVEIVESFLGQDKRLRLLTQATREGKASAVNLFLQNASSEVLVLESADTIPTEHAIEALVGPFADPSVGMAGGHPIPTNPTDTFMGFGVNFMWELHHQVSLRRPKMGELIAFRSIFRQIPYNTAVDEASIEPLIIGQGMHVVYAPDAVVYNRGPETVADFIKQRRRIYAGHLYVKETLGYNVATMNGARIVSLYFKIMKLDWRYLVWAPLIAVLEIYVRYLGYYDYSIRKRNPFRWAMVDSTKGQVVVSANTLSSIPATGQEKHLIENG